MIRIIIGNLRNWIENLLVLFKNRKKITYKGSNIKIKNTQFLGHNMLANGVNVTNCSIGVGTYINQNSRLFGSKIGNYCSIADNVFTGFGHHPLDCISTYPAFFYDTKSQLGWNFGNQMSEYTFDPYKKPLSEKNFTTIIGHDVWIGSHVLVMDGVTIGNGAVIGAGSVVTKDIPPFAIAVGIPARIIRYRHTEQNIKDIEASQWWNKDINWIKNNIQEFHINGISFLQQKNCQ